MRLLTTPQLEAAAQDWQDGLLSDYLRSYDDATAAHESGALLDGDDVTAEQVIAEYGFDDTAMAHHDALVRAAVAGEWDQVAVHCGRLQSRVATIINERGAQ